MIDFAKKSVQKTNMERIGDAVKVLRSRYGKEVVSWIGLKGNACGPPHAAYGEDMIALADKLKPLLKACK